MIVTTHDRSETTPDSPDVDDDGPPRWMAHGICAGHTELFFAPHAERPPARLRREAAARQVCMRCPVRLDCRDHARVNLEYGVWGGESEAERAAAGYAVPAPIGGRTVAEAVLIPARTGPDRAPRGELTTTIPHRGGGSP